jgi:hypothetical protein
VRACVAATGSGCRELLLRRALAWRACAALAALWLLVAPGVAKSGAANQPQCRQVPEISRQLAEITGLPLLRAVPCSFIDKQQVNAFLKQRMKEETSPEEIRAEELTLKKFGLVPPDFDLAASTVDLLTEQAAAFYDYNKRKLFLTGSTSEESQDTVLAHELAHALADQNFNLARYINQGAQERRWLYRAALRDGRPGHLADERIRGAAPGADAVWATRSWPPAWPAWPIPAAASFRSSKKRRSICGARWYSPIPRGWLSKAAVLERDHQRAFCRGLHRPSRIHAADSASGQVLRQRETHRARASRSALPRGYKGLVRGELGELEHGILLEQYVGKSEAREIAPHWRGCRFELRENKKAARVVLLYAVEWDDDTAAARYFSFYRQVLEKKWKHMVVVADTADRITGTGDDGGFELHRTGAVVTSVEGMEAVR